MLIEFNVKIESEESRSLCFQFISNSKFSICPIEIYLSPKNKCELRNRMERKILIVKEKQLDSKISFQSILSRELFI